MEANAFAIYINNGFITIDGNGRAGSDAYREDYQRWKGLKKRSKVKKIRIMKKIIIIGASGHGKVVADIAVRNGYKDIVFLDDDQNKKNCGNYPVVGKSDEVNIIKGDVIIAIGNAEKRQKIQNLVEKIRLPTLVHPDAVIANDVNIGEGTVIMAGTVINSGTIIGKGCIVNTSSSIDHDCVIGDFVHISIGSHIAGTVCVMNRSWIGAGAIISNNVNICSDCIIGAGAVLINSIDIAGTYIGIPAKKVKDINN